MVTLIDQRNIHLFQPLLYQVATAALSPADIAMPIRRILRSRSNTSVVLVASRRSIVAHGPFAPAWASDPLRTTIWLSPPERGRPISVTTNGSEPLPD